MLKPLFGHEVSAGKISEILTAYGSLLASHETVSCRLKFVSDEIFVGQPILVTVEPLSNYLLSLEAVNTRDKVTGGPVGSSWLTPRRDGSSGSWRIWRKVWWEASKSCLATRRLHQDLSGRSVPSPHAVSLWITRAERKAYAAITQEYEALEKFERAKSERTLLKHLTAYETAHVEAEQWMQWVDESRYLFRELKRSCDSSM